MKCWICGAEMKNTVGGCYQCENCKMTGVNDLVMRYPMNWTYIDDITEQNENTNTDEK